MQTFLPYPSYRDSARTLDRLRLGKQRVETYQILIALFENRGYIHHPAVLMWRGHERSLLAYQEAICDEWVSHGYVDTCWEKSYELFFRQTKFFTYDPPPWLGDLSFHRSHMSNLVKKDPGWYRPIFPTVPDDIEYVWPVKKEQDGTPQG